METQIEDQRGFENFFRVSNHMWQDFVNERTAIPSPYNLMQF